MNYIAQCVYESFEKRFPDDPGYLEAKARKLGQLDRLGALLYINEVDENGLHIVAETLGVEADELRMFAKWLRKFS